MGISLNLFAVYLKDIRILNVVFDIFSSYRAAISCCLDMKTRKKSIENEFHHCENENSKKGNFQEFDNLRELENDKQTSFSLDKSKYKMVHFENILQR